MKRVDDLYEGDLSEWRRVVFASFSIACEGDVSEALREYREFFKDIEESEFQEKRQECKEIGSSQYSFDFLMEGEGNG